MARALLRRRRVFAVETEAVAGTAETLTAADAAIIAFDHNLAPDIPMVDREAQGSLSRHSSIPGARRGTISIMTHLHGSGGSGQAGWGDLLLIAGMTESSGTYSLDSTDDTTGTAAIYEDGRQHQVVGAKNNPTFTFRAGQPVEIRHEIIGKYLEPQSVALLAPTYPTVKPPRFVSGTLTIGGTSFARFGEATLAFNNTIELREDANADDDSGRASDGTGYAYSVIVNRNITLAIDPEAVAFATKNWYEDLMDADEAALSIVVGSAANNTITFAAPKIQPVQAAPGDRRGILTDALTFQCNISASTGDSELTIAFS